MKVFLSHQKADSETAGIIATRLKLYHQIDVYLDVVDPNASTTGDDLGEYLRQQLSICTQLMAVVSAATKTSWWVPWEIGVATEKDYPIATFAGGYTTLPEYLRKWPYLQSMSDVDAYAEASKMAQREFKNRRTYQTDSLARRSSTKDFYRVLRSSLRQ
ncbi:MULTISPECIES: toll/interleukin-1 receptor domain-containing protein [Methylorubrum]|jgi:hypothetical protein|uniref:TIR domain-containing protein n=1 Tax=Methylorubrum thiocyanatum TaxID=47958 RepID=A0AA40VF47_9HYPH|nr:MULTISPECIES: toll/interleukin-1 receptor domain-containing protein [Methylorubrum]MBA8916052.1 hypothetical protein [Methylorubrum thiocyanatum]UGB28585.1 toll/interleukin-1 receptor domain-containing protein [Methylorubrum sp. B1-46]GMA80048.1 hypothetical protein GCM10025880_64650 [Methylorubrum aminovorans]GMA80111.1 hypothetical protein GCM10025880_65280 [Methylorubrum aminovorans]